MSHRKSPPLRPASDVAQDLRRIRDDGDVGLIHRAYAPDGVVHTPLGAIRDRETQVQDTLRRLTEFPDRPLAAEPPIWCDDGRGALHMSQIVERHGRHIQFGRWGAATGRTFRILTASQPIVAATGIQDEWIIRDDMGMAVQLGIDPHRLAEATARAMFEGSEAALSPAVDHAAGPLNSFPAIDDDAQAELLSALDRIYNGRMFGSIGDIYAADCAWHGPLLRERVGIDAIMHEAMRLCAMLTDGLFVPRHLISMPGADGGLRHALRWTLTGRHLGYGSLGVPTRHALVVNGISHFHLLGGLIREEWTVYDELSLLVQIKLAALKAANNSLSAF